MATSPLKFRWFSDLQDLQDIRPELPKLSLFSRLLFVHQVVTVVSFSPPRRYHRHREVEVVESIAIFNN